MYVLLFQPKLCLGLMNRLNCLKQVQHFHALNSNQKTEKENKKKLISFNFSERRSTKYIE